VIWRGCRSPARCRGAAAAGGDGGRAVPEWLIGVAQPQPLTLRLELELELELDDGPGGTDQVRDLAEREGGCCSFFTFAVAPGENGIRLGISVDHVHEPVLDALAR
jgi:hypothetical protein